ncbi:hypothetical protein N2382_09330 [SAR92 clade bacterium H921]|nr:hypothetical protein [SAR92 clade bacterium H921]
MRASYLKRRHNVYWFQRRPPKKLHDQLGSKTISINLHTTDWTTALIKRDQILGEWAGLSTDQSSFDRFEQQRASLNGMDLSDSLRFVNEKLIDALSESRAQTQSEASDVLRDFTAEDRAAFWAWRKATKSETPPEEYAYSIRDALAAVIPHKRGTITDLHLDKYTVAVDLFMGPGVDGSLEAIRKGAVVRWIDTLTQSNSTKNTYLSCLGSVYQYAQDRELINDQLVNPFKGIKLGKKDTKSYKMMPHETLRSILSLLKPKDHLPAVLAINTGMRLSEVFNAQLQIHEGIHCLVLEESASYKGAKTEAGNRIVPIPDHLLADVLEQQPGWSEHGAYSKRFGKAKAKVINCRQTVFHSLRVSFITEAQRAGYTEQQVAWLVGHEAGKGDAMTGKLYFKGYRLQLMKEIIEAAATFKSS